MYSLIPSRNTRNDTDSFGSLMRWMNDMVPGWNAGAFRTDILDEGDHYTLQAELPGFRKEDIHLEIRDGVLTLDARHEETIEEKNYLYRERRSGSMSRSFRLDGIDEEGIRAKFENGVLELILPKEKAAQPESRRIEIQ